MARSNTIEVKLTGDNSSLIKALNDSEGKASSWAKNVGKLAGAAALGVAAGAVAVGVASVRQASDLAESANAVAVTFGEQATGIRALAEEAATGVGLSASEFNGLAVQFAGFARGIAGPGGDVVATIDDITKRSADFASVMNLDVADAAALFQSGLAGETEGLRKYGIDLSAVAVEQYALANGIAASASEMTEADKVQARYELLMQETARTAGDFANTSDSVANRQRVLSAQVKDVAAKLGTALLPALAAIATVIADRVIPFVEKHLPAAIAFLQGVIAAVVTFITRHWGTISTVFRTSLTAIQEVVAFFQNNQPALIGLIAAIAVGLAAWAVSAAAAAASTLLAIAPFVAIAAAIALVVAGVVYAYQNFESFRTIVDTVRAWLVDVLWPAIKVVADNIAAAFLALAGFVQTHWDSIKLTIETAISAVKAIIETVTAAIQVIWQNFGDEIVAYIKNSFETMRAVVQAAIDIIRGVIKTVTALISGDWSAAWDGIKQILQGVWDGMKAIVSGALEAIKLMLSIAWGVINLGVTAAWELIKAIISGAWETIKSTVSGGIDAIVGFITGLPDAVSGAVSGGFDAIYDNFKSVINKVIDAWNGLSFPGISIPGFDPPGPGSIPGFTTPSIGTPNIPRLHTGGRVPGPVGREVPIIALGGEVMFTADQTAALGSGQSITDVQIQTLIDGIGGIVLQGIAGTNAMQAAQVKAGRRS